MSIPSKYKTDTSKKLYRTWLNILSRCYNPRIDAYKFYGALGIEVCDEWRHDCDKFISDVGNPPTLLHTIDRINGRKGYSLDNCRWATRKEQSSNRKSNHSISFQGETLLISEWAKKLNTRGSVINKRLKSGWTIEDSLTIPMMSSSDKKNRRKTCSHSGCKTKRLRGNLCIKHKGEEALI